MTVPSVSVVMPLRNAEATLEAAISSLQNQTWKDIEIILVDHDSDDRSREIVERAAAADTRIQHFSHSGTFVEAANLAWQQSSAPLVARMDSDDVAHPNRIAEQLAFLEQHPNLAGCGTLVNILKRGVDNRSIPADDGYQRYEAWVNSVVTPDEITIQRFVDSPLPNPTAMIRRPVLESLNGYQDPKWAEDYDFWLRLLEQGYRLGKVEKKLLDWYDSDSRSTRNLSRYDLSRFQEAKSYFLERLPIVKQLGVAICGAGPVGKEMATLLRTQGVYVQAFLEVNKKQIGNRISGIPVLDSDALESLEGNAVILAAVGQDGARERIRELVERHRFTEGKDFFCVA